MAGRRSSADRWSDVRVSDAACIDPDTTMPPMGMSTCGSVEMTPPATRTPSVAAVPVTMPRSAAAYARGMPRPRRRDSLAATSVMATIHARAPAMPAWVNSQASTAPTATSWTRARTAAITRSREIPSRCHEAMATATSTRRAETATASQLGIGVIPAPVHRGSRRSGGSGRVPAGRPGRGRDHRRAGS